jgi:hypothetical protein
MVFGHRATDRPQQHLQALGAPIEQPNQLRVMSAAVGKNESFEPVLSRQPRPRPFAK